MWVKKCYIRDVENGVEKVENDAVYLRFGEALRFRRVRANLKQKDIAEMMEIDPSIVSKLESRTKPPTDHFQLSALAQVYNASVDDIVTGRVRLALSQSKADEQKAEYSLGVTAFNEYPRLRHLLNVGWAWLRPEMKDVLVRLVEVSIEQARNEFTLLGRESEEAEETNPE